MTFNVQASISRESSLFCMLSLSDEIPTVVIGALNLTYFILILTEYFFFEKKKKNGYSDLVYWTSIK